MLNCSQQIKSHSFTVVLNSNSSISREKLNLCYYLDNVINNFYWKRFIQTLDGKNTYCNNWCRHVRFPWHYNSNCKSANNSWMHLGLGFNEIVSCNTHWLWIIVTFVDHMTVIIKCIVIGNKHCASQVVWIVFKFYKFLIVFSLKIHKLCEFKCFKF